MPQNFNPAEQIAQVIYPRPVTGFRRVVQVSHPMCGEMTLLSNDASFNDAGSPNYTKYAFSPGVDPYANLAFTPGAGPYQKAIHSAGTREVTWSIGGDVTAGSLGLLELLAGSARGVNFRQLLISQGTSFILGNPPPSFLFDNQDGNSLPWNQFSLSGNQNSALTFSLEGKATIDASLGGNAIVPVIVSSPVPSWTTGNNYVLSWSLSHNVNLQPNWFNTSYGFKIPVDPTGMLPAYYRALDSEFTLQLTTAVALADYTWIQIGFGHVNLFEVVVTSQNITYGDRNSVVTYQVSSTNAAIQSQQSAYSEFVGIFLNGVPDAGYG